MADANEGPDDEWSIRAAREDERHQRFKDCFQGVFGKILKRPCLPMARNSDDHLVLQAEIITDAMLAFEMTMDRQLNALNGLSENIAENFKAMKKDQNQMNKLTGSKIANLNASVNSWEFNMI